MTPKQCDSAKAAFLANIKWGSFNGEKVPFSCHMGDFYFDDNFNKLESYLRDLAETSIAGIEYSCDTITAQYDISGDIVIKGEASII